MEQVNCLCSLEEILHFCGYLKNLWIREKMVLVKLVAHYMYFHVIIIEFSYLSPAFGPSLTQNTSGHNAVGCRWLPYSAAECLIMCALEHIGATFKVKWLLEKFLCAFTKLEKDIF